MLTIEKNNGETKSEAICDRCGEGLTWHTNAPLSRMEYYTRKQGWSAGKRNLCPTCNPRKGRTT